MSRLLARYFKILITLLLRQGYSTYAEEFIRISESNMKSLIDKQHSVGRILIIGGVSGSGKSTVGKALAERLSWPFIEGDMFHSEANINKMRRSEPLGDDDRKLWLRSLRKEITRYLEQGRSAVLACSALKANYRKILRGTENNVNFVFLIGDREDLHQRLVSRQNHFIGAELLDSQLAALQLTDDILLINSEQPVEKIVDSISNWLVSLESENDGT